MGASLDWRLLREVLELRNRFHRALEAALAAHVPPRMSAPATEPPLDVWENDDEIVVEVELPGVTPDRLDLRLAGDALVVSGSYPPHTSEDGTLQRCERPRGGFQRVVRLSGGITGAPEASLARGVLTVRLAKAREGRRIVPITTEAP